MAAPRLLSRAVPLALSVLLIATPSAAFAGVYWSNGTSFGGPSGNVGEELGRASLDGRHADRFWWDVRDAPMDLEVSADHFYWPTYEGIVRADRSSHAVQRHFITLPKDSCDFECDLVVTDTYLYWTDSMSEYLGRATLDGTQVEPQWHHLGDYFYGNHLAADDSDLFVSDDWGTLMRVPEANPGGQSVLVDDPGMDGVTSLAVDDAYLYYGGYAGTDHGDRGRIGRVATSGGTPDPRWFSQADGAPADSLWYPARLAVDDTHLYFSAEARSTQSGNGAIGRVRLADMDAEPFLITDDGDIFSPYGLAVDQQTVPTPPSGVDGVTATAPRRSKVGRKGLRIKVRVTADQRDIGVRWAGSVKLGRKRYALHPQHRNLEPGRSAARTLRLNGRQGHRSVVERKIKRRLHHGRRVVATVQVAVHDTLGNHRQIQHRVRLR